MTHSALTEGLIVKAPGWYPSNEYPGRDQWWDGTQLTQMIRPTKQTENIKPKSSEPVLMNPQKTVEEILEPKRRYLYGTDWMVFIPLVIAAFALIWLAISTHPFYTGERSISYKEGFATITSVQPKIVTLSKGRKVASSRECMVTAFTIIDDIRYKVDVGNSCNREKDTKTPITYDPKDIEKTASTNWIPSAQRNFLNALSTLGFCLLAAGVFRWIKSPVKGFRKKPKKRKLRSS